MNWTNMYNLIYKFYFLIKRKDKRRKDFQKTSRLSQWMIGYIEDYYNTWVKNHYSRRKSKHYGITKEKRRQRIIVSLTSYPKRIDKVWLTVETLLRQSIQPDEIILWLSKDEFEEENSLPQRLLAQTECGLSIRWCENLKSHKKYYYVMQEYPEDLIVLADDDMFYPYDMIELLLKMHEQYPEDICTSTAQVITESYRTVPSKWRNPRLDEVWEHSKRIQVFSGSGSLFPPHVLPKEAFDKERIKELCPYADDLWLTFMAFRNHKRITAPSKWRAFPVAIYGTGKDSLYYLNAEAGKNDEQWRNMLEFYGNDTEG